MGSYISVLCVNYNKNIYNENQYANLFIFRRNGVRVYILVATNK